MDYRPIMGDVLTFNFLYKYDSSVVLTDSSSLLFGVTKWRLEESPISKGDENNTLADASDITVIVDGTEISNSIIYFNPISGFISLDPTTSFWEENLGHTPAIDSTFMFEYFQSQSDKYQILYDDEGRTFDTNLIYDDIDSSSDPFADQIQIGYKFRANLLARADLFNSSDTSTGAFDGTKNSLFNNYDYFFSPEHLIDTDQNIILNDDYLNKDIPAQIILNPGLPYFNRLLLIKKNLFKIKDYRTLN